MTKLAELGPSMGLEGRVAIVTGGGARHDGIGNGRAAAILMSRAGAKVMVVDLEEDRAAHTAETIVAEGGVAAHMRGDVTNGDECAAIVKAATDRWGRLDILDNNVGITSRGTVVEETVESWENLMRVNVNSVFHMSRQAIPAMIAAGNGGSIVNVSSIASIRPRGLTVYTTSKGAVNSLTQAMAVDHGPDGIRVNAVLPGPVYTPLVIGEGNDVMTDEQREQRRQSSALSVEGTGWDIGHAVLYLVSDWAKYVSGHLLVVDGGVTIKSPPRG